MPGIRRTAQAEEDLIDLWLYIAQDNPSAADRLLDEIEDKCSLLAANPQLGAGTSGHRRRLPLFSRRPLSHPVPPHPGRHRGRPGGARVPPSGRPLSWGLRSAGVPRLTLFLLHALKVQRTYM